MQTSEKKLEQFFKAFANRRRIAILNYLKKRGSKSVGDIADSIGLSVTATSKHLVLLSRANLLEEKKEGLLVYYRINENASQLAKYILKSL